jgi:pimeloyl-ACP methyl ester carboxylesterase
MIRLMFLSVLSLFAAMIQAAQPPAAAQPQPAYTTQPCDMAVGPAVAARLQCGSLKVQSPDGSRFQLAVVRKAAAEPKAGAAPVLYLHGGPGGEMTRFMALSDADFVPGHELIAIDMRGSGRSTPLFCPALAEQFSQALATQTDDSSLLQSRREAFLQCQQQMLAQGYSSADFGSVQTVQDLELLRAELQIEQWHLYGVSYGTVVALQYLAAAPKALVSVTLDSVYPPDELLSSFKLQQDQWLRQLDQLCQQQPRCSQRFGSMPELFNRAQARVSQNPLLIGQPPTSVVLTSDKLRLAVMAAAMSEQSLSLLPYWLAAVSEGKAALLAPWAQALREADTVQYAAAMATECADRKRFYSTSRADSLEQLFGLPDGVCAAFGLTPEQLQVPQVPQMAKVRTPVLLLTGGLDVFQPDSLVLSQWLGPLSQLVAVPFALHGVRGPDLCLRKMVSAFIQAPERFGPPTCLSQLSKPYLITELETNPAVAAEFRALSQGQPSIWLLLCVVLLAVAATLGWFWPLLRLVGRWLRGRPVAQTAPELSSAAVVLLTLCGWAGFAMTLWQGVQRQSAELWLGLPIDSQPWRLAITAGMLPLLALIWWLARKQCWRHLLAQLALFSAALIALALQLLP